MWSENLDNKIRAAAGESTHEPGGNAWDKMEVLLDQHLPREKKRRGFLFFLLLALLVAVPGFFLVKKYTESSRPSSVLPTPASDAAAAPKPPAKHSSQPVPAIPDEKRMTGHPAVTSHSNNNPLSAPAGQSGTISSTGYKHSITTIPATHQRSTGNKNNTAPVRSAAQQDGPALSSISATAPGQQGTSMTNASGQEQLKSTAATPADTLYTATPSATDTAVAVTRPRTPDTAMQKSPSKTPGRISFTFSAGPDISSVGGKAGQWNAQYGIGISFRLSDRLAIRTGFYATRKIYSADSAHYHAGFNTPLYYKLTKVDADCAVYEIPVLLTYHFNTTGRHNWFAAAGASSLIMKKEDYVAQYEIAPGQTYSHPYSFVNENRHLFSIIHISGGYQYHFSKRLGLMAEPYIKLPVAGVGYGKVKLSSAGILFSLRYSPF